MKILLKFNYFYFLSCTGAHRQGLRALLVCVLSLSSMPVFSVAGDVINNIATIDFVFEGNTLVQESSPFGNTLIGIGNGTATSFIEDRLINFSVASIDAAPVAVASLQSSAFLSFTVTNNGNAPQDFLLTAINTSPSPFVANIDSFDPVSPIQVFVEDGSNAGYLLAEDTAIFIDELAIGETATVYVAAAIPATIIGDAAAVALVVQVAEGSAVGQGAAITNDDNGFISPAGIYSNGGTSVSVGVVNSITNTSGLEVVFNDPASVSPEDVDSNAVQDIRANGQHSDTGVFLVQTVIASSLVLNKTVTVIDTLGGTDPHAGATLRYQIDVVISGVGSVNNLVITDLVPVNTTFTPASLLLNGVTQTDLSDAPTDYSEFNGSAIVVDLSQGGSLSVAPATSNLITFDVTID